MRILLAFVLLASPMMAQAPPACPPGLDLPSVVAQVEKDGGRLLSLDDVPGADYDSVVTFHLGAVIIWGDVKDGCVMTPLIMLFKASSLAKTSVLKVT